MKKQQALELLNLDAAAGPAEIEAACASKKRAVAEKLESAPTDALKQKFAQLLEQLDEAKSLLAPEASDPGTGRAGSGARASLSETKMADLPSAGPAGDDEAPLLRPGQLLAGRYEVEEQIGAGGMGAVYRALDRNTGEPVALKVLLPALTRNERARERFLDEARLSQKLSHPNIVNVYDVQHDGELYFLTMELLEGQDLRQVMENRKLAGQQFTAKELLELAGQLCNALSYAHKHTVHRDLKPENIWLADDGTYKLMDFGIAQLQSTSQRTQTGAAMGTAYYMAPEQLKGQKDIDGRADLYAVGVLLYEMASGDVPAGVIKPLRQKYPSLPKGFAAAVMECLQADPEERPADAQTLSAALNRRGGGGIKLPLKPLGIGAAAVLLLALGGWGINNFDSSASASGLWDSIRPISEEEQAQQKAAVARIQGEIKVIKDRLHNARRQLASDVRDAERNESEDLEALLHWQQLTDNAIFNGSALTELEGEYAMAETLLREGSYAPAEAAMTKVRDSYKSIWGEFNAAERLYRAEQDTDALAAKWQRRVDKYNVSAPDHTQAAADARRRAGNSQLGGDFTGALVYWQEAQNHLRQAFDATQTQVAKVDRQRAEEQRRAEEKRKAAARRYAELLASPEGEEAAAARTLEGAREFLKKYPNSVLVKDVINQKYPLLMSFKTKGHEWWETYDYDKFGNRVSIEKWYKYSFNDDVTYSNTTMTYDDAGNVISRRHEEENGSWSISKYTYDRLGRMMSWSYKSSYSGSNRTCQWKYDDSRLKAVKKCSDNKHGTIIFYNDNGDVIKTFYNDKDRKPEEKFTYNADGKLVHYYKDHVYVKTTSYRYNDKGLKITEYRTTHSGSNKSNSIYTYDDNGNMISETIKDKDGTKRKRKTFKYEYRKIDFSKFLNSVRDT